MKYLYIIILLLFSCTKKIQKPCGFAINMYSENISWKGNTPILVTLDVSVPAKFEQSILYAANVWNTAIGYNVIIVDIVNRDNRGTVPRKDGRNVIYFDNNSDMGPTQQAITHNYFDGDQIVDSDIVLNTRDFVFYPLVETPIPNSGINAESVLIHEMGHMLGLAHDDTNFNVMNTFLTPMVSRVTLSQDNINNVKCEY